MKELIIIDTVGKEAVSDYGERFYTHWTPLQEDTGIGTIKCDSLPILKLRRRWTYPNEQSIEACTRRLPPYAQGNTILLPNNFYHEFEWAAEYVIKDEPLRELIDNQEKTLENQKKIIEEKTIQASTLYNDNLFLKTNMEYAKQHPIKFMFKQLFKRKEK